MKQQDHFQQPNNQSPAAAQQQKEKRAKRRLIVLLLLLLLLTLECIIITIWALFWRSPKVTLAPDYALQELEIYQTPIADSGTEKFEAEDGGGAVSLTYSSYVTVDLSENLAVLMFANPAKSTHDMVLQIAVRNEVLIQSGRITPGHKVTALDLPEGSKNKLTPGGYNGKFVVSYYDPATGEKSVITTEIPISISVVEHT